jgi:tRNA(fMet)-specific endonuclease VapC
MRRLRRHADESAIPALVWHELRFGCARLAPSRRREAIERYVEEVVLTSFPVLEYDQKAADWHALERARLMAAGKTPPFVDGQIAAIAHVNDLTLITSNKADFRGFKELRLQSWA